MRNPGSFGQTGGAGGVNVERQIVDGYRAPLGMDQTFAAILLEISLQVAIYPVKRSLACSMHPDHNRRSKVR